MKFILAFILVCSLTNLVITSKNTPFDGAVNFFDDLGLDQFPVFYNQTKTNVIEVKQLLLDIVRDLSHNYTFVHVAQAFKNLGQVMVIVGDDVIRMGQNLELHRQIMLIVDGLKFATRDPKFLFKCCMDIRANFSEIAWAFFDAF